MIGFGLTDEQQGIKNSVKSFREKYIEKLDLKEEYAITDRKKMFSWDLVREASRLGLRTAAISPEYGGLGLDTVSLCLAVEELSYGDLGIAVVFAQTWKISRALERSANKEQKEKWVTAFARIYRRL